MPQNFCNMYTQVDLNLIMRRSPTSLISRIVLSRSSRVCADDRQNRALELIMGVAGYPTTTTAIPRFNISLENALVKLC